MKILVLSDSHSSLMFMRRCVNAVKPDCVIHLGDHYDDGGVIREENPKITCYQVPGNCDCIYGCEETKICQIAGVTFLITHGHRYHVKTGLSKLLNRARDAGVDAVLFGHTHIPLCQREDDGLLVMNPGAAGFWGGSAGIIEIQQDIITACHIIRQADLDALV